MRRAALSLAVAAATFAAVPQSQTRAEFIYWAQAGGICRATLDGADAQNLLRGFPEGVALDLEAGKVYWTDNPPVAGPVAAGSVRRANRDGSQAEALVTTLWHPAGIALGRVPGAFDAGRMYWADDSTGEIWQAGLGGTSTRLVLKDLSSPFGLALDLGGGKVYWARSAADERVAAVQRANLDGSDVQALVKDLPGAATAIALDAAAGKVYFGYVDPFIDSIYAGMIKRANLDGSDVETIVSGLVYPAGIALDVASGKVYWTDTWLSAGAGRIERANLDGSNPEIVLDGLPGPRGIALDLRPVPEPASLVLLASVGLAVAWRRGRPRHRR